MNSEVLDKIVQLMMAAFGLVAALAWNEAIQALFTDDMRRPTLRAVSFGRVCK